MSMWKRSNNSESVKPAEVSIDPSGVIVRKDYHHVDASGEDPEHWNYLEAQMSHEQYKIYEAMKAETSDIEDALIELAEIIAGGE